MGVTRAIKRLLETVPKTETIEVLLSGNYSNGFGLVVLTDQLDELVRADDACLKVPRPAC